MRACTNLFKPKLQSTIRNRGSVCSSIIRARNRKKIKACHFFIFWQARQILACHLCFLTCHNDILKCLIIIIIKFPYNARSDWLKQRALSEIRERVDGIKPWSSGPASSRKWTQVELGLKLALGGQTDTQVSSQVHASRK